MIKRYSKSPTLRFRIYSVRTNSMTKMRTCEREGGRWEKYRFLFKELYVGDPICSATDRQIVSDKNRN